METKEDIVDQLLCISCLCVGRSLHKITNEPLKEYYLNIINEIQLCSMLSISCPSICFECIAMLKKVVSFREQVKDSYRILQTYTNENLHECLLSDVSRPPRLKVHSNKAISIIPAEDDAGLEDTQLIDVKSEEKCDWDIDIEEHNISSPEDYKEELSDSLNTEREINEIICDKRSKGKRVKVKRSKKLKSDSKNLHGCLVSDVRRQPRLDTHTNKTISTIPEGDDANVKNTRLIDVKSEMKREGNDTDIEEHNISSPKDYKEELSDNLDVEREIEEIIGNKRNKGKRVKEKRSKKLKSDSKQSKPKNADSQKILTIELTYEQMLEERDKEATRDNYVKAEYKYIEENDISSPEDYNEELSDNLDVEREIEEIIGNKRNKAKRVKEKRSKKLKIDSKQSKPKNTDSQKILTIELTYEQMLEERDKEATRDNYVKAEYKCESCLIGFNYSKSYESHVANKHSSHLGEYSCPICKTVVQSVDSFTAHYKRHMRRYECNVCHKRTQDMKVMQQHYYTTHEISLKEYQCNLCGKISKSIDTHRYHRDTHKARVQCSECDKTFRHRAGLMNHRLAVHELHNAFPCSLCDKVFRWKTSLKRHLEKHEVKTNSASAAFCTTCDISFSSVCSYQRHLKNSLKHVTQDQFRYICDHCNRRFSDKTKLRDHIEEKHLHKTYHCHICLKPSKNRVGLDQHIRNVHKGRPNNKMCHHCGKGFPTQAQLESHIRTHTGERPFICEYCPTTFSQQSNLYKHNRQVHLNIKSKRLLNKKPKDKVENNQTESNQVSTESSRPVALYYTGNTGFVM